MFLMVQNPKIPVYQGLDFSANRLCMDERLEFLELGTPLSKLRKVIGSKFSIP
jgi:hypothetical protein